MKSKFSYIENSVWALIPFVPGYQYTDTLANSEDSDEMSPKAAFHQGPHCLLRKKQTFRDINVTFYMEKTDNP